MSSAPVVLGAKAWRTNAAMIADVARLGYLKKSDVVLDPTYGRGKWWTVWRPDNLAETDLTTGTDFRALPFPRAMFDAAVFDPPYVCTGGRATSTLTDFYSRYGLTEAPTSPEALQLMINGGLAELARVVKPATASEPHYVLVKCANYVSSGKLWLGVHRTTQAALELGYTVQDQLIFVGHARSQPKRKRKDGQPVRQHHARANWSTLLVLETPRRAA